MTIQGKERRLHDAGGGWEMCRVALGRRGGAGELVTGGIAQSGLWGCLATSRR